MTNPSFPRFTVVGHPNKGKSSIVSTLTQTDQIDISQQSGTTENATEYEIAMPGSKVVLVDTPGFQRPSSALDWLKSHVKDASQRKSAVEQFVASTECATRFPDEVKLLRPIMSGSAIIYVVDGSRPYGPEYEFEMEILRWSGQPRMAIINPIENSDYVEQWQDALHQYFNSVKVFNPITAEFEKQQELFRSFAHLNEKWQAQLNRFCDDLGALRQKQFEQSVMILEQLLKDVCRYSVSQKVLSKSQAQLLSDPLKRQYEHWVQQREQQAFGELLQVFKHQTTSLESEELMFPPDLFDTEQWYLWGLNKRQLIVAASLTGAMGGASLDIFTGGSTLLVGTLGGGTVGAASAVLFPKKIAKIKVKGVSSGGWTAAYGPIQNQNFPYVIMGRFIYFYRQVCNLSHANRKTLNVSSQDLQASLGSMAKDQKKALNVALHGLIRQRQPKNLRALLAEVIQLLPEAISEQAKT
ncbi:GTPase/DUF3482 domain-containing protein [Planctobacterium marinum]|uniref:G domain-containing protein n=1 Tax=Planctobacterium marinum TaxID=1631968 RepID=A0AA48KWJ5_9ALTE|nr:hypothetical protein MACH26_41510 [Planctobacterium marinum]